MMDITVIGAGYVGMVTSACLADLGHNMTLIDIDPEKVSNINNGIASIYEEGLAKLVKKNHKRLLATTEMGDWINRSDLIFVCVGTPDQKLKAFKEVIRDLRLKVTRDNVVVIKSTVPPGTTSSLCLDCHVAVNPEFLRESRAVSDFMCPDRVVIGTDSNEASLKLKSLYDGFPCPIMETDPTTAELIKYASNAFLATKISFINEIAGICEDVGADVKDVAKGMGLDHRISDRFLEAGVGFGGSCFKKDLEAITKFGRCDLMKSTLRVNKNQVKHVVDMVGDVDDKEIALLGLAFKEGTDDLRESQALKIMFELMRKGASVRPFDPILSVTPIEECLRGADIVVIAVPSKTIMGLIKKHKKLIKGKLIVDGARVCDPAILKKWGFEYKGVGYGTKDGQ